MPAYSRQPPRPPSSPELQQPSPFNQASPSTVDASPHPTPGPLAANSGAEATGRRGVDPQARMRSSIACEKCRKSKTKCVNTGIDSICKACESGGRECRYATLSSSGVSQRRESTAADGDVSQVNSGMWIFGCRAAHRGLPSPAQSCTSLSHKQASPATLQHHDSLAASCNYAHHAPTAPVVNMLADNRSSRTTPGSAGRIWPLQVAQLCAQRREALVLMKMPLTHPC